MALTTVNPALLDTQAQYTGFKNRIINGAMMIDQRNAGASISATGYPVDRFGFVNQTSATFTANGALIYNDTNGDKAIAVLAFGGDFTVTGGTFQIVLPAAGTSGIIRID